MSRENDKVAHDSIRKIKIFIWLLHPLPLCPAGMEGRDLISFYCFSFFFFFRASPAAYGSSQARDQSGATAARLHNSHSNVGSEPRL